MNLFLVDLGTMYTSIAWLTGLIAFILNIFIFGYGVSVTKANIDGATNVPNFDFVKNFVDGIKAIVLYFIYYVIPLIITLIVAAVTGLFTNIGKATTAIANAPALNASAAATGNTAGSLSAMFSSYSAVVPTLPVCCSTAYNNSRGSRLHGPDPLVCQCRYPPSL